MYLFLLFLATFAACRNLTVDYCWKKHYGRGFGKIPHSCPPGKELQSLLCHEPCKQGYRGVGFLCWKDCPDGYHNDGLTCRRPKPLHITARQSYSRGVGTARICSPDQENRAGLCYKKCKPGFKGIGPTCWEICSGEHSHNCGATCATGKTSCFNGVLNMGASALELIANIGLLVMTLGTSAAVSAATKAGIESADIAAEGIGATAKLISNIPTTELRAIQNQVADKLMDASKDISQATALRAAEQVVSSGMSGSRMDWTFLDPTGIASVVKAFKRPSCH